MKHQNQVFLSKKIPGTKQFKQHGESSFVIGIFSPPKRLNGFDFVVNYVIFRSHFCSILE